MVQSMLVIPGGVGFHWVHYENYGTSKSEISSFFKLRLNKMSQIGQNGALYPRIEHFLLHCELNFNEREAMRTTLLKQVGITELTMDLLLGCNNSDLRKEYGMTITLARE